MNLTNVYLWLNSSDANPNKIMDLALSAVRQGNLPCLSLLVDYSRRHPGIFNFRAENNRLLNLACLTGQVSILKFLLACPEITEADICSLNSNILFSAALSSTNSLEILSLLMLYPLNWTYQLPDMISLAQNSNNIPLLNFLRSVSVNYSQV